MQKTVYVVWYYYGDGTRDLSHIASTEKKAKEFVDKKRKHRMFEESLYAFNIVPFLMD